MNIVRVTATEITLHFVILNLFTLEGFQDLVLRFRIESGMTNRERLPRRSLRFLEMT